MNELIAQVLRASQHRFIGRMARDPEIRYFESGNCVCNARILINKPGAKRDDGQEPDGFKVEIWGEKAAAFADATTKGDLVDVTGRVKSETWTDRTTGEQRSGVVVTVESFEVLVKAGQGQQAAAPVPVPQARPATPTSPPVWGSSAMPALGAPDDDGIPF
jgi:single-strand DNA-binding protein